MSVPRHRPGAIGNPFELRAELAQIIQRLNLGEVVAGALAVELALELPPPGREALRGRMRTLLDAQRRGAAASASEIPAALSSTVRRRETRQPSGTGTTLRPVVNDGAVLVEEHAWTGTKTVSTEAEPEPEGKEVIMSSGLQAGGKEVRPGPRHAQPRAEALSGLRAIKTEPGPQDRLRAPGQRHARATRYRSAAREEVRERDDRKRMMERAARNRAPPAGGQGSGQADHGERKRYYYTTRHFLVVRRTLRRPGADAIKVFQKGTPYFGWSSRRGLTKAPLRDHWETASASGFISSPTPALPPSETQPALGPVSQGRPTTFREHLRRDHRPLSSGHVTASDAGSLHANDCARVKTARSLRDVWSWAPPALMDGFWFDGCATLRHCRRSTGEDR